MAGFQDEALNIMKPDVILILHDVFVINRMHLEKLLKEARVEILTQTTIQEINDEGIKLKSKSCKADKVIGAIWKAYRIARLL